MPRSSATSDSIAAIARAVVRLGRRLRAERPQDSVSLSALGILATLHRLGSMSAAELATAERLKPQSLTRLLSELEEEGLIERRRGKADRRALITEITSAGRGVLAHDMAARRAWLASAMARALTPSEQEQLAKAADLMLRLSDDSDTSAPGDAE